MSGEAPAKQCPECNALIYTGYAVCPECGHEFPPRQEVRHTAIASDEQVMSGAGGSRREELVVSDVSYHVHLKQGDPLALPTMRVEYQCGLASWVREWVCLEHPQDGYAHRKAEQWWLARSSDPVPGSVEEAVDLAEAGALAEPDRIVVEKKPGDQWERIVSYQLGPKPPRLESADDVLGVPHAAGVTCGIPDDEIPF